jgi:hypothetical protein
MILANDFSRFRKLGWQGCLDLFKIFRRNEG